jgi:hypothetical protein
MRLELLKIGGGDVNLRPARSLSLRLHQAEYRLSKLDEQLIAMQRQVDVVHALAENFCNGVKI